MANNEKGEKLVPGFGDLTEAYASIYVNKGPFMDEFDPGRMFEIGLDEIYAMEIHSSIDSFYRYGYVIIPDRVGFRETLSLTGNEIITVRYANNVAVSTFPPKIIHFNIYDMEETSYNGEIRDKSTNKAIKLHLIEAPFFLKFNQRSWARIFGHDPGDGNMVGAYLHDIFSTHIQDDLKLNEEVVNYNFENMNTQMYWGIPNWKSQKTFQYLLQFAKDEDGFGNVKLFTTSNLDDNSIGLRLSSISQLFKQPKISQVYSVVNVGPMSNSRIAANGSFSSKALDFLIDYKFETYDLTSLVTGLGGGYTYNYDYLTSERFIQTDDYNSLNDKEKYFGQFALWTREIADWQSVTHLIGPWPKQLAADYLNNKMINQKYQLKCVSNCYLNHTRNVGDKVHITFPSVASAIDDSRTIDEQMSGDWVIQEMVDVITNTRGFTSVSFIKDSFFNTTHTDAGTSKEKLPEVNPIAPLHPITKRINN